MKTKFPQSIKMCLWSYDTSKMSLSNPHHRFRIILNILNHGTEEDAKWMQDNCTERQIKETIKKSYASEWFKWSLKRWSDYYKVKPKWKTRLEYLVRHEKDKDKILRSFKNTWWPYGGDTI